MAPAIDIRYSPQLRHRSIPVEVVARSELLPRIAGRELAHRQRVEFDQLVLCTGGEGRHQVDFEPVEMRRGTLLRIHPGQVQQFVVDGSFEADHVVWPIESQDVGPAASSWFPGSGVPTRWRLDEEGFARVARWVDELRTEQDRFDGSPAHIGLMKAILSALLFSVLIEAPDVETDVPQLPQPYVDYRRLIEDRLYHRPNVAELASQLGYSSRTIDRACQAVSGETARQVLDHRVAFEVRRLLTHTSRPIARIAVDLGFSDPSNFSKFVKRHLGRPPGDIRSEATSLVG